MRRLIPLMAVVLLVPACGGGTDGDPDPLQTCEEVAAAAVVTIQDSIDLMDEASATQSEPAPETITAVEEAGAALEARASALECSDTEMAALMADLADGLEAESVFGQLVIESLKAGDDSFFGDG